MGREVAYVAYGVDGLSQVGGKRCHRLFNLRGEVGGLHVAVVAEEMLEEATRERRAGLRADGQDGFRFAVVLCHAVRHSAWECDASRCHREDQAPLMDAVA